MNIAIYVPWIQCLLSIRPGSYFLDGNHFLYVGHLESTGQLALVTHHGSRSLGGLLYKFGMAAAKKHTSIVAPRIAEHQAWLDFDSDVGQQYWEALQIIREWTKANHYGIHDGIAKTFTCFTNYIASRV